MKLAGILAGSVLFVLLAVLLIAYICYRMAFYVPKRKPRDPEMIDIPEGKEYEPFRPVMEDWIRQTRKIPHEKVQITSADGLKLTGKFYEFAPGAPMEIMFHGYRGNAERDLSGGVLRGFALGRSVLLPDQRCSGDSDGNTITFGIKEHKDCLDWVDFAISQFGPDVKIILTGISMGAATVLMAAGKPLPKNVIGVLADCGYSSPEAIIKKVIRQMGLPEKLAYPFVRLGGLLFGDFDLEDYSPEAAIKNCRLPVIFFHGQTDDFVPWDMSSALYEACPSRKRLVTIPDAGHGLSYAVAPEYYLECLREFFGPEASYQK